MCAGCRGARGPIATAYSLQQGHAAPAARSDQQSAAVQALKLAGWLMRGVAIRKRKRVPCPLQLELAYWGRKFSSYDRFCPWLKGLIRRDVFLAFQSSAISQGSYDQPGSAHRCTRMLLLLFCRLATAGCTDLVLQFGHSVIHCSNLTHRRILVSEWKFVAKL